MPYVYTAVVEGAPDAVIEVTIDGAPLKTVTLGPDGRGILGLRSNAYPTTGLLGWNPTVGLAYAWEDQRGPVLSATLRELYDQAEPLSAVAEAPDEAP